MRKGPWTDCLVLLLVPLMACYRYTPVRSSELPMGVHVRAHLSAEGRENLEFVPRRNPRSVEGEVVRLEGGTFFLEVRMPVDPQRPVDRPLAQTITLAPEDIVAIELKEPDRTRTAALIGGVGVAFGLVALMILSGKGENRDDELPPPPELRVSIPLRR
jgi:hypothetical protein